MQPLLLPLQQPQHVDQVQLPLLLLQVPQVLSGLTMWSLHCQ
jgi:hypothetical protein